MLKGSFARAQRQLQRRIQDRLQRDIQGLDHLGHRLAQRHPANRLAEQWKQIEVFRSSLARSMNHALLAQSLKLGSLSRRLAVRRPDRKLEELSQRVAMSGRSIERLASKAVRARRDQLENLARTLHAVSPLETIGRGYAVLTSADTGEVISSVSQVEAGDAVSAQIKDGKLDCTVDGFD